MDNEWSGSDRDLLSQHPERANALATSTGRRLVMKCTWSRCLTCKRSKYDLTYIPRGEKATSISFKVSQLNGEYEDLIDNEGQARVE